MNGNGLVDLDLSTLGNLNQEVRAYIPSLVNSIPMDDDKTKAKLTITIDFKRVKNTETAIITSYSVKPTFPKKAQVVLCRTDLCGNLMTDPGSLRQPNLPFIQPEKEEAKQ